MGSCGAFAEDTNTVELTTAIKVEGAETCVLDVSSLGGKANWNLNWNLADGADTGSLTGGTGHEPEPLFVKVKFTESSSKSCSLNAMKIDGATSAVGIGEGSNAFRVNTNDTYWRFMPVMAQLKLFTEANGADDSTTGAISLDKVTVVDRKGTEHLQQASFSHAAMAEVVELADFNSKPAIALTNNYLADNGVLPLAGVGSAMTFKVAELAEGQTVKSALIGVGALVAKNPENESGEVKVTDVALGTEFSMPYTVSVTLK